MLNRIWLAFILSAFIYACVGTVFGQDIAIFQRIIEAIFDMAKLSVDIALGLIGLLAFWLGISKIAEKAGLITKLARLMSPVFRVLMPSIPANSPAQGHVSMNLAANMMGLDNAATPLGLKAMESLQQHNPHKDTASDAQIMFLVLNTSSVTIFPVTVFMYRAQAGAAMATDVFIPILLATLASTLAGILAVATVQKLPLFKLKPLLIFAGGFALAAAAVSYLLTMSATQLADISSFWANFLLLAFICLVLAVAGVKKLAAFDYFVEGAKEGFTVAVQIIPYLVAMLVAIAAVRASGMLDGILSAIRWLVVLFGGDSQFVDALPTGLLKPLSGSGARAMMVETMNTHGADSFSGRLSSVMQGSTETTFYVLAVYFGSVGIKYTRHAISCGLIADVAGITSAILVCYWFFA
ncbi:spore maturation protein A/B [Catenovulum agarivorans DS-2]|uniref:Spore maturation protein A/B n=1 Tax=Catenovulum agarivorans DS-2 TaxID=1328313 RepID=W7QNM7_9ALTE|nr:spore maturation protein [Catenovulum agarivorans]EWH09533.1 spore maturation protein A/B [Catenovulum agarivorans DS-2]